MMRSWMLFGILVLGTAPAVAEENQATGDEIVRAVRAGAASDIASALLRGERTQCFGCIGTVETLLYHEDGYVRQLAGIWLRKRPLGFGPVMVRTRETMQDTGEEPRTRALAAQALGNFRDWHAGEALSDVARSDDDAVVRAAAVRAIAVLNVPRFSPAVSSALGDADAGVRAAGLDAALSLLGFSDHEAVLGLVADPDASVRWRATMAVGELGIEEGAAALEGVVLGDSDPRARQNAAYALGVLGASDSRATLEAVAEDSDRWVRSAARIALAMLR